MSAVEQARDLAARIAAGGKLRATLDPKQAATTRPTVLLAPPVVDWTRGTLAGPELTWRLVLLSSHAAGTFEAWEQLDLLLGYLADLVDTERAEPGSYVLGEQTVPAYIVTTTT